MTCLITLRSAAFSSSRSLYAVIARVLPSLLQTMPAGSKGSSRLLLMFNFSAFAGAISFGAGSAVGEGAFVAVGVNTTAVGAGGLDGSRVGVALGSGARLHAASRIRITIVVSGMDDFCIESSLCGKDGRFGSRFRSKPVVFAMKRASKFIITGFLPAHLRFFAILLFRL